MGAVAAKVSPAQKGAFAALKGKVEGHLRAVNAGPAALPPIDFAAYSKVTVPGMVDSFEAFVAEGNAAIAATQVELAKFEAMKPVEEMNAEEALDAGLIGTTIKGMVHPDVPSFWPHTETWDEYVVRL